MYVYVCTYLYAPSLTLIYFSVYIYIFAQMWMCGEQKRPEGTELMRKCVLVSYNFVLLDTGKIASPSSQDECGSWPSGQCDEEVFALPFQKTSMITEKCQFLVRCEESINVPHMLEDLGNGK